MTYPKINSLFKRELSGSRKLIIDDFSCPEFESITRWTWLEKIDGTNIRILFQRGETEAEDQLVILGRNMISKIPAHLREFLEEKFTLEKMRDWFPTSKRIILHGEGVGPKIQDPYGSKFRSSPDFLLFDIQANGWWLDVDSLIDTANRIGCVYPLIRNCVTDEDFLEAWGFVRDKPNSLFSQKEQTMEGIVAKSYPMMKFRCGTPIKFKLKVVDVLRFE